MKQDCLCETLINDDENGVEFFGQGKIGDKICGNLLERSGSSALDREIRVTRWMCVNLVLLTDGTPFHIVGYEDSHSWLPIVGTEAFKSTENSIMSEVVVLSDNVAS